MGQAKTQKCSPAAEPTRQATAVLATFRFQPHLHYLINQTPGGPLVRALRARAGILLLINQRILHRGSESVMVAKSTTKLATLPNHC